MNFNLLAAEIITAVGGISNIKNVTHCATRLRFNLVNDSIVNDDKVKAIDGVMGITNKGGQYQLIIGPSVGSLYDEVVKLVPIKEVDVNLDTQPGMNESKSIKKIVNKVFDTLSGIFVMFIPVLIAAGMISAVLSLLTTFHLVSDKSNTYIVISAIQQAIFYFLPLFAGYCAGVKLNCNPFFGLALGAILCYSTINGAKDLSVFGLSIATVTYNSTVFPVILGVWLMSYIEKGLKKITPDVLKGLVIPTVTLFVGTIATLVVLGPIGSVLGNYLATFITFVSDKAGWLAPAIIAFIYPIMVFTGMHYSLIPIVMTAFATSGFDPLLMVAGFIGNIVEGGAAAGTSIIEKDKEKKANALTIAFSALCGITEPALFGITLRNKKTLISVMTGGFCGALFAGIMSCKAYGFVGGLPSLPLFLDPKGGFSNLIVIIISAIIGFTVTFVLTVVLNKRGSNNEKVSN
jgi:Phosphotransferase system IIC components, glucose/maltose/N-acetylglucosamine-specific